MLTRGSGRFWAVTKFTDVFHDRVVTMRHQFLTEASRDDFIALVQRHAIKVVNQGVEPEEVSQ